MQISPAVIEIQGPVRARLAFVGLLAGGKQEFPNDPALDQWRHSQLKTTGLIKVRRRSAAAA